MAQTQLGVVLRHLHRMLGPSSADEPTDRHLLDHFAAHRDEGAFEELLRRHGPMVLGVCRRLLGEAHDADDVFQATFLVLVHKAASVRNGTSLGCWLYGVAYRLALKARTTAARRRAHERRVADMRQANVMSEPSWDELRPLLDEELARLPEQLRAPLVLCYLEGKTNAQAAREIGCPAGSMSKRLARGREALRQRLTRRGVALTATALGLLLAHNAGAAVPAALGRATLDAGLAATAGAGLAGVVSVRVAVLVRWGVRDMVLAKCKPILALVLALGVIGTGAGVLTAPAEPPPVAADPQPAAEEEQPPAERQAPQAKTAADGLGDPLPAGALVRLGTARLRHGHNVMTVAFAPDGKSFVSTAGDHLARRWEVATGRQIGTFGQQTDLDKPYAPTRWMHSAAFSPDGKTLATGDHNDGWQVNTIHLWDTANGAQTKVLQGHTDGVLCLAWSPDGKTLASASNDGTVRMWDPDKGTELRALGGHQGAVRWVAWSAGGKQLASAGADGTVRLWDPDKGTETRSITAHEGGAAGVGFSPDGKRLVSGGADKAVRLWEVATGKEVRSTKREKPVRAVAFAPDGKLVAFGVGWDVVLWDPDAGKDVRTLKGPHNEVSAVAFSPDSQHVAAASHYGSTVFLWEVATGKRLDGQTGHEAGHITRLAYSADGRTVTSYSADQTVRQWDPVTGRQARLINTPDTAARAACLAPDGKSVACVSWAGHLRVLDLEGKELRRWKAHEGQVTVVAYAPGGKLLASGGMDQAVILWDADKGTELRRFQAEGGPPNEICFSPDGKLMAVVVRGQPVHVFATATGQERQLAPPAEQAQPGAPAAGSVQAESAAFSPDGQLLAVGTRYGLVRLWDLASGQPGRTLSGHVGYVMCLAFSPDGRTLAAGSWRNVRLWEIATGKERKRLAGHEGDVTALAFSPDGRTLVSGGSDTTALVWDLTGRLADGKLRPAELSQRDLELAWTDLRGDDAARAYPALWTLAASPKQALPLLRGALPRATPAGAEQISKLIAGLDDDDFDRREKATEELVKVGEQAEPLVKKALEGKPSVEMRRRLEYVLERLRGSGDSGERLQQARALEVLEATRTPEARAVLEELARGEADAWLTREAKAALARLGK
jgi:RNA polymerase sigma factor (sigma-70 family)